MLSRAISVDIEPSKGTRESMVFAHEMTPYFPLIALLIYRIMTHHLDTRMTHSVT